MKNLALTIIIGCSFTVSATAHASTQERNGQGDYRLGMTWPWSHGLKEEINHLNRMRGHVRWQLRNYRGNKGIRRDFDRVSRDIDQINSQFRSASPNRGHLRRDIEEAHAELHHIETALHVKSRDFYSWR